MKMSLVRLSRRLISFFVRLSRGARGRVFVCPLGEPAPDRVPRVYHQRLRYQEHYFHGERLGGHPRSTADDGVLESCWMLVFSVRHRSRWSTLHLDLHFPALACLPPQTRPPKNRSHHHRLVAWCLLPVNTTEIIVTKHPTPKERHLV